MKQPLWRQALSYLMTQPIEQTTSPHNPHLRVVLKNGRYQLQTLNAIYSYGDLYDNFSKAFARLDLERAGVQRVLILGFGLGSIPLMLEKMFHKHYDYTAVEIDAEVLRLAEKYVLDDLHATITFHVSDALDYVAFAEEKFDMICMDVFIDDTVPTAFEQAEFLTHLKSLLTPNGLLLFNKLAFFKKDKQAAMDFLKYPFKQVFTEGGYLDVQGNYILLNRMDFLKN
jgi:SAM-dependent methyltransferase